jgi:ABC-type molybdate transport system permease subunit
MFAVTVYHSFWSSTFCINVHHYQLQMGTTHKARVLKGTIVVTPFVMTSIQTILEDMEGQVVKVSKILSEVLIPVVASHSVRVQPDNIYDILYCH